MMETVFVKKNLDNVKYTVCDNSALMVDAEYYDLFQSLTVFICKVLITFRLSFNALTNCKLMYFCSML